MKNKELWKSLEEIGEDEDRKIQESEQARRDDEFQINRSSLKTNRINTLTSLISVILSIGALAISWSAYQAAHTERIVLRAQRFMGDHASQMEPQPGILGPAILDTYWECLLSNTGDRTVSIIEANVWIFDNGGFYLCTLLKYLLHLVVIDVLSNGPEMRPGSDPETIGFQRVSQSVVG